MSSVAIVTTRKPFYPTTLYHRAGSNDLQYLPTIRREATTSGVTHITLGRPRPTTLLVEHRKAKRNQNTEPYT
ncbi:hypothetical protein ACCO45_005193 [Purpureocillium lilacinum]|uniref:Uncharacterized protein n=1 Tax=Purpureocillium lilacinum TaxID=33203 RepID=A0ACC4DUQ8_PURLI